ncbi:MAG: DUF4256 domain-containing protein [Anaerolineales bacterium]
MTNKPLTTEQREALLATLQTRFNKNMHRHPNIQWDKVQAKLDANPQKLVSLHAMEETGGEPDVVGYDAATAEYLFVDCCAQSPAGRRSLCYDRAALEARKANKPQDSAQDLMATMGIAMLTEEQYRALQQLGEFDTTSSSWVQTPAEIRTLGGALFCDRRYNTVFVYHNGAESYYAARGVRGLLRV